MSAMKNVPFDVRRDLPKRVRFVREMREMSQADLARKSGLDQSAVAHLEAGRRLPGAENLRAVSQALMVSSDYLLGLSERVGP